jgi:hypothetical protein
MLEKFTEIKKQFIKLEESLADPAVLGDAKKLKEVS